jgi:glycerol-3-phosphate dehydrogenase (NAD(P)+)
MNISSKYFTSETIIINLSKGLENNTLKRMSEVILEITDVDDDRIVSLYGPSHAEEVILGYPTTLVAASSNERSSKMIQDIFSSNILRVYSNKDIKGVELGGSLKNVIAIAAGICDGIGFGDNTKAALLTRGMAEITRLGVEMGAKESTFSGLSGIGDLIATCLSKHSRNRYVGEEIGKGKRLSSILDNMDMVAEGVKTTRSVYDLSKEYNLDMPISEGVNNILFNDKNPKSIVSELMNRDLVNENI